MDKVKTSYIISKENKIMIEKLSFIRRKSESEVLRQILDDYKKSLSYAKEEV